MRLLLVPLLVTMAMAVGAAAEYKVSSRCARPRAPHCYTTP